MAPEDDPRDEISAEEYAAGQAADPNCPVCRGSGYCTADDMTPVLCSCIRTDTHGTYTGERP